MEWSIQDVARSAGVSSRTLRHYGDVGVLPPSRVGSNGHRYYDQDALVRLQRVLLLRGLGVSLSAIAEVLEGEQNAVSALHTHLGLLEQEHQQLTRRIASVRTTLGKLERGEPLMPDDVLDGFDHTQYRDEVIERWGRNAYERGDRWWRSLSEDDKREFQQIQERIASDYGEAHRNGLAADSAEVQAITARHCEWLALAAGPPSREYFKNLGQMYVDDPRFGQNYDKHDEGTVGLVRDAMALYADENLE